jgi:hypothetical protein
MRAVFSWPMALSSALLVSRAHASSSSPPTEIPEGAEDRPPSLSVEATYLHESTNVAAMTFHRDGLITRGDALGLGALDGSGVDFGIHVTPFHGRFGLLLSVGVAVHSLWLRSGNALLVGVKMTLASLSFLRF